MARPTWTLPLQNRAANDDKVATGEALPKHVDSGGFGAMVKGYGNAEMLVGPVLRLIFFLSRADIGRRWPQRQIQRGTWGSGVSNFRNPVGSTALWILWN